MTTRIPNSMLESPGGGGEAVIAYSTTIDLSNPSGNNAGRKAVTVNTTWVVGATAEGGAYRVVVVGDGTHTLTVPGTWTLIQGSLAPNLAANKRSLVAIYYVDGAVLWSVTPMADLDLVAPAPSGAPHVDNATPTIVRQSFDDLLVTNGIAAGDCTVTGHTVSAVAISGAELQVTVTVAFVAGESRTLSVAANKLKDSTGNLCAAISNVAITDNVLGGGIFDETWPGIAGASLPAGWIAQTGFPTQLGGGLAGWAGGASGVTVRNTSATNVVITAVVKPRGDFPAILFRSDATGANANYLLFHASTNKLRLYEHAGGVDSNINDGSTTLDQTTLAAGYTVELTLSGTSASVRLAQGGAGLAAETFNLSGGGTGTTMTLAQNLSNTYVGLLQGVGNAGSTFGEIKVA